MKVHCLLNRFNDRQHQQQNPFRSVGDHLDYQCTRNLPIFTAWKIIIKLHSFSTHFHHIVRPSTCCCYEHMNCSRFVITRAFIIKSAVMRLCVSRALWFCDVFMRCSNRDAVSVAESLHYSRCWGLKNLTGQSHSTVCRVSTKILHLHTQQHNISNKHSVSPWAAASGLMRRHLLTLH